jgi:hypothetical protein
MPKGKISMGKKSPAKPTAKAPRRPQLDKMGPGEGYSMTTARYYLGNDMMGKPRYLTARERISGARADQYNAEDAYNTNKSVAAFRARTVATSRVKTKTDRKGGK